MNSKIQKLFKKADELTKKNDLEGAIACYEIILENYPQEKFARELAFWGAGECYLNTGNFQKAKNYLEKAIKLNSQEVSYRYLLGVTLTKLRRFKEALKIFKFCLKQSPTHPAILRELGWTHFNTGHPKQGKQLIQQSLKINPTDAYTLCDLATIAMNEFRFDEARKCLEIAKKISPEDKFILQNMKKLEFLQKKFGDKIKKSPKEKL